jgi:drug/metabolite transporter (DMT)-like permease
LDLEENLIHLLLPFCSSLLVIVGLLVLRRAQACGVSTWTVIIVVCCASAAIFPALTMLGGQMQPASLLWQPAIIGLLFVAGQVFMFLAVKLGDVSIAAPVLGIKVLIVPALGTLLIGENPETRIWLAAAVAMLGIGFVQVTDASVERSGVLASIVFALLGALSMTLFDLLIQRWAPAWGAGYFLPISFTFAALFSLAFVPLADRPQEVVRSGGLTLLLVGALLMALQAIGMTFTLAQFGDATRVNIVYSLRGIWGVTLTWLLASQSHSADDHPSTRTMLMRLVGALLIGVSIVLSVM